MDYDKDYPLRRLPYNSKLPDVKNEALDSPIRPPVVSKYVVRHNHHQNQAGT